MSKVIHVKVDEELLQRLNEYAKDHRVPRSYVIRLALKIFLEGDSNE